MLALLFACMAGARSPIHNPDRCSLTAAQFRPWASRVWKLERWQRFHLKHATLAAYKHRLRCAAGAGHRQAMRDAWKRDRRRFERHQAAELAARDINHRWTAHWAPDWSGPTLPPYLIAALAEEAGRYVGVSVPGWTMEQVTIGESGSRPGSAGVDVGGTVGWGLWAVTDPFANSILARYGWTYDDMLDPLRCSVAMAEIFKAQGIGAWYGTSHVTDWDRHYRGHFDLRLVLGGRTFRQALN